MISADPLIAGFVARQDQALTALERTVRAAAGVVNVAKPPATRSDPADETR